MGKIRVRVQPGAKHEEVTGWTDGVLRVKLTAPPIEGRANKALVELLADRLNVAKSKVNVVAGMNSREKLVEVAGLADEEIVELLDRRTQS